MSTAAASWPAHEQYATMAAERCSHGIKSPRRPYLSRRGRSKALGQTELVSTVSEEQLFAPLLGLQWSLTFVETTSRRF